MLFKRPMARLDLICNRGLKNARSCSSATGISPMQHALRDSNLFTQTVEANHNYLRPGEERVGKHGMCAIEMRTAGGREIKRWSF